MNSLLRICPAVGRCVFYWLLAAALGLGPFGLARGTQSGQTFASPQEAVRALAHAASRGDTNALAAIFGPAVAELRSPDPVEAQNEVAEFAQRLNASNHLAVAGTGRYLLEVGADRWPFAVPLVQKGGRWGFDTQAGKEELLNRRIGRDELDALQSVRAYVEAQRQYASKDRDGDQVLEYAQRIISTPGTQDGLYWPIELNGVESPLGPLFAEAQNEGYLPRAQHTDQPQPFHGYFFRILTRQGSHAPGGAYHYIINGNMIGGFALVAWPADYGNSGIMTFIINQQGTVYEKDLGLSTQAVARGMAAYDPDPSWEASPD